MYIYIYIYIHIYIVLSYTYSEWLKNELNYVVTCNYFQLILQPHQTVTNVN